MNSVDLYRLSASLNYRRELFIIHWGEKWINYVKVSSNVKVNHFYPLKATGNLAILNEVYTELFTNSFVIANFLSIWFIKAIYEI